MAETTTPRRWADAIHAWADCRLIEMRRIFPYQERGPWCLYSGSPFAVPPFEDPNLEWRPAPPRPWFRVAIMEGNSGPWVDVAENESQEKHLQEAKSFVRWDGPRKEYDPK